MLKYFLILLLFSCSKSEKNESSPAPDPLLAKRDLYLSLQSQALNEHGYAHSRCDSVGFTALCIAASGCPKADLFKSEDNGRWYRSPEKDCFDKGESQSDFSKDMALMLFVYIYKSKAKDTLSRFKSYVDSTNYVMGRPTDTSEGISRVVMSPGLILTMRNLDKYLSGQKVQDVDENTTQLNASLAINTGFQAHLDVLKIWLDGSMAGYTNDFQDYILREQVSRQPDNAIFQAVYHLFRDGDQSKASAILSNETLFPTDRLPETKDRCEEYIFQRDYGDDWKPCDKDVKHDAVDFLVAGMVGGFW